MVDGSVGEAAEDERAYAPGQAGVEPLEQWWERDRGRLRLDVGGGQHDRREYEAGPGDVREVGYYRAGDIEGGGDQEIGSLEAGKRADLVLVRTDGLEWYPRPLLNNRRYLCCRYSRPHMRMKLSRTIGTISTKATAFC